MKKFDSGYKLEQEVNAYTQQVNFQKSQISLNTKDLLNER